MNGLHLTISNDNWVLGWMAAAAIALVVFLVVADWMTRR